MEKKKQTYYEFFKEKYRFNWLFVIAALLTYATIREYNSEMPSNAIIPLTVAAIMGAVIFGLSFYQYKKGDDTRFR